MQLLASLLENATVSWYVNYNPWVWPTCEILHFVGMALLFGTVGLLDLRLLGAVKGLPLSAVSRLIPLGVAGFAMCVTTGYIFVAGSPNGPPDHLYNLAFQMKMGTLLLAGINILAFYATGVSRSVEALGPGDDAPGSAKAIATISLVLWLGVIYFGRMIMYSDSFYVRAYYPF